MKTISRTLAVAAALLLAAAVGQSDRSTPYTIKFAAVVGDRPFTCGATYAELGISRSSVTPVFLRFYVSDVALIDSNGTRVPLALDQDGTWQQRNVAFLSFEGTNTACASGSPQNRQFITGHAPPGHYVGIVFTLGVPQSLDHADATVAASPLNLSDMFWSWQDGYKFFRFDARVVAKNGHSSAFVFHLGSTGCSGEGASSRCSRPNDSTVSLRSFDPSRTVLVDVARLVQQTDFERGGCMMSASENCSPELRSLGLAGEPQSVFRVR